MAYRKDEDLEFLAKCSNEDLEPLVEILIKDKDGKTRYTEELTKSKKYMRYSPDHQKYWDDIAAEIQTFGANTIATIFRFGKGVTYKEILCDVCQDLKVNFNEKSSTSAIEKNLLDKVYTQAIEELSNEELKKLADAVDIPTTNLSHQATVAAVQYALMQMPYFVLQQMLINVIPMTIGRNLLLSRLIGVAAGPIGWALTGAWTAVDLAGAAKRVTVPAVIQVAVLRKKYR
ncbi:DUF3944 domain-containing protein [Haemophilus haemolyticus]|jgi:UPF0174 protein HP_1588|uniref:DUF3944 domain-containing protein n=1 Tax=Haemophilus haemolyticus TaxID=726 RepID=UPI000E0D7814|nr:DUF3944 domain-containing protein [Haemophilus haemolyticus]